MTTFKAATSSPVLRVLAVMAMAVLAAKESPAQVSIGVRPPPGQAAAAQPPAQSASKEVQAAALQQPIQAAEKAAPKAESPRVGQQHSPSQPQVQVTAAPTAASAPSLRPAPSVSDGAPMVGLRIADLARVQAAELQADAAKRLAAVTTPKTAAAGASSPAAAGGAGEASPAKAPTFLRAAEPKSEPPRAQLLGIQGPLGSEVAEVREPSGRIGTFRPGARIGDWEVRSVSAVVVTVQRTVPSGKSKRPAGKRVGKPSEPATEVRKLSVGSTF